MANKYRFFADLDFLFFFKKMATKWWKMNIFTKMCFICFVYIQLCQLAKQYVSIPEIVAFEHLWPFLRKRTQNT